MPGAGQSFALRRFDGKEPRALDRQIQRAAGHRQPALRQIGLVRIGGGHRQRFFLPVQLPDVSENTSPSRRNPVVEMFGDIVRQHLDFAQQSRLARRCIYPALSMGQPPTTAGMTCP